MQFRINFYLKTQNQNSQTDTFIFYLNIVPSLNSIESDSVTKYITSITLIFLSFLYPLEIQHLVHGEYYGGKITIRKKPLANYLAFWLINFIAVRYIINSLVLYNVFFNPSVYFILSNVYFINIITNIIGRSWMSDHPASMILNTLFIGLFR